MGLKIWLVKSILTYNHLVLVYFLALNSTYLLMMIYSYYLLIVHRSCASFGNYREILNSHLAYPVSIIVPAYNEEKNLVESVRSLLMLQYPEYEIIIVNDGSEDLTLEFLIKEFGLRNTKRVYRRILSTENVRGVYESTEHKLIVVDKERGGRADALNSGINISRYPLICSIDADSVLDDQALLRVVKPILDHPHEVCAVGGIVGVANGSEVLRGRVVNVHLPSSLLAKLQIVEYLRAFLSSRTAWSGWAGLLLLSGAFSLFRKDVVIQVGGFSRQTVCEDMELVVRIHRFLREQKRKYQLLFVPDPICWTEVPERWMLLANQRNRWHRGLIESLAFHKKMFLNPKYGVVGLLAFPYYFFFEMLGPVIEAGGYLAIILGFLLGIISWEFAATFFLVAVFYGVLLSVGAVILDEQSFKKYPRWQDSMKLILCGIIENLGYRQLLTVWKAKACIDFFRKKKDWGKQERRGFQTKPQKQPDALLNVD